MSIAKTAGYILISAVFGIFFIFLFLVTVLFASTTQTLEPDSILAINNLSPNDVTVLQDDPDNPQNNDWLTADDADADTSVRVGFPAPLNNLSVGAGLQEFRVLVRSTDNGTDDPELELNLYENGAELNTLITGEVITDTGGQVIAVTWDASELSDTTGAGVELEIVGSGTGGQPGTRDTVEVGAVNWNAEIEAPTLVQDQFRFYENRDDTEPTVALADENTRVTAVAPDEILRLRANIHAESGSLPENSLQVSLQYAPLGSENECSAVASGAFAPVGDIDSGDIWRGYANPTPTDGSELSSALLSLSDIPATYEEESPSAFLSQVVNEGERAEWDLVLQNNGAESGEVYCFRLVDADGDTELDRYDRFAEAEVVRGLTQVRYRWRDDDGDEETATWKEAESTPAVLAVDETARLRVQIDNEGTISDAADFRLEYATSTAGPWSSVPVDNPGCDTTTSAFRVCETNSFTDGATTTQQLSGITGSVFIPGFILDDSNPAPTVSFQTDEFTEMEWALQPTEGASLAETYFFRLSDNGESVGTYSEFPAADIEGDNALLTQNYYRWYEDNDALTPTAPWSGLGENTAITSSDDPPQEGELLRARMSLTVQEDTLPENARNFRLQYAERESSCSATTGWSNVGGISSNEVWRGVSTSVADGTELTDLLLSVSDVAGTFEEENPSAFNPNEVLENNDLEYDWIIQHNGAAGDTSYCFRMVNSDGVELSGYENYPTVTTAGYSPESDTWRWYGDSENITPTDPLANEEVSPTNVAFEDVIKLRALVPEVANVAGENVKLRLQFSESSSFSAGTSTVEEIEACEDGDSLWCYAEGGGEDNEIIPEALLSGADECTDGSGGGCGTHNESGTSTSNFTHPAGAATEYEFTIRHAGARANTTYYFRLLDAESGEPVPLSGGSSYPNLSTAGTELTFSIEGVGSGVSTEGVVTDVATTPTAIPFGSLAFDQKTDAVQRKNVSTNATNGFQLFVYERGPFISSGGDVFAKHQGTNASPTSWSDGCTEEMMSCYGYHAGDDILEGGSTRFAADDTYARFEEEPQEIAFSSQPVTDYSVDTVISTEVTREQPAGQYGTDLVYIIVPSF